MHVVSLVCRSIASEWFQRTPQLVTFPLSHSQKQYSYAFVFSIVAAFGTMDISALQKLVTSDLAMNRTPLFVIGDVGASICGQVDNVQRLQEVCRANSIWLHCRGHSLAALAITQGTLQTEGQSMQPIADSISLNLGSWLALPNLPVVVNYCITVQYFRYCRNFQFHIVFHFCNVFSCYIVKSKIRL